MRKFFPAKVLLFGEHRVLRGAPALAVPYHGLGASWHFGEPTDAVLSSFATFLLKELGDDRFDKAKLARDVEAGIQLSTSIPFGYGLGSSGAVCAAFWDRYHLTPALPYSISELQQLLARMESFFHGQSSGIDPLVSYLDQPLQIIANESPRRCTLAAGWRPHFFLLDTGQSRRSGALIGQFIKQYDLDQGWSKSVEKQWGKADSVCQEALLKGDFELLAKAFRALSEAQLQLAPFLVPEKVQAQCLGESYALKVCGAGGGGYMLGLTNNWQETQVELSAWSLLVL